uniref:Uncharacterized protein n=1 Tax=Chaetoceros debilis TaxID=122233 RepID=A0A7S3QH17_9STRA|mmetsp:Transcript_27334/g.40406  ORF Transcript_27334/g.40406 Transcript_27334/m.40406 type:complete len:440 (+) Transcript_27334:121-1440(+)|eukprot:CAMPEP_0194072686 /NCGR_PEP_ID=MMETSP0149-20130528/362_1 /TAXON_ID=122233 /ORGANISM="Chaetoceros debilis, Strain MM31A-1" /LENGTH=439 /DNA_ID=CAMNT_0038752591 /DNA_START=53 /DNA_END=1372 /DNA_ORIENTATION=-
MLAFSYASVWCTLYLSLSIIINANAFITPSRSPQNQGGKRKSIKFARTISEDIETSNGLGVLSILDNASVTDPSSGRMSSAMDGVRVQQVPVPNAIAAPDFFPKAIMDFFGGDANAKSKENKGKNNDDSDDDSDSDSDAKYAMVVVMPQLGDFDSAEYAEMLAAVEDDLKLANISLRIIGIGDTASAVKFCNFAGLDMNALRIDPMGELHQSLQLHAGPNWDVPSFIPEGVLDWFSDYVGVTEEKYEDRDTNAITRSWLNYMAMCAGISSPDTLPEIFRGYVGDKNAPERIRQDEVVTVPSLGGDDNDDSEEKEPFIAITGTKDVKLGPFNYQQLWKDESGYQRPVELATVRLRVMVEVLSNFGEYVPDQRFLDVRGATYLFRQNNENEDGDGHDLSLVYAHVDTGVLSYSKTMARPLSFLEPYIGKKALNPLGLGDPL